MTESTGNNYKDTLNLPKTAFDMKANLTQREPEMVKRWAAEDLYGKIRGRAHPKGKWVLHDGPPYANGDIHMGHLINKVLKDMVVKFRTMQGHDSPYVPGWDCHGLPIESAIQKELGPKFRELTKDEVRKRCAAYASKYVKLQSDSFQRLGVFGDYARPYLTMDKKYEGGILDVLAELVQRDLVYRQKKPVHWCTFDRTALAEAELEYATKKDTSVYVTFELVFGKIPGGATDWTELDKSIASHNTRLDDSHTIRRELMIWTTTPWTLPANRAVALHPDFEYVLMLTNGVATNRTQIVLVAKELANKIPGQFVRDGQPHHILGFPALTGKQWVERGLSYRHPLEPSRICPVVLADYVTLEDGTGLVHTAPGHGKEDYQTGIRYGLEVYNPVLSDGRYDDTVPEFLRGKTIWDANQLVIDKLKETGALFHHQEFAHEYPHCWRCKKPVIFRATEQWFVKAAGTPDGNPGPASSPEGGVPAKVTPAAGLPSGAQVASPLWTNAKQFVNQTTWIPTWGKNRIDGMLDTRPDWCISRQRSWGVPIPAFFDPQGKCLLTEASVRKLAAHFREHGADSWYTDPPEKLLGGDAVAVGFPAGTNLATLEKGQDILDVWFESGASHHAVLECTHPELGYPANLYLEGSDQHRGWFQSSLLEASGYKSEPPFKEVLTHGFVVDDQGKKYSKSSGNYVPVEKLLTQHGADVLRLWVSSVDYQNDIKFSAANITTTSEAYRKIRNTMRYLLGNLYDFNPQSDCVAPRPYSIDAWMQSKVDAWAVAVHTAYDAYEFHNVFKQIYEFCNVEISAVYAKAIKDRLYCELPNSPKRRSSQSVCFKALGRLIELSAPVLVFTAEEAWQALRQLPGCSGLETSIHTSVIHNPVLEPRQRAGSVEIPTFLERDWTVLMRLIEKGNKILDDLKRSAGLGNPLDAEAIIVVGFSDCITGMDKRMADYGPEIEDALGVGFHRVEFLRPEGGVIDPFNGKPWDIRIEDTREKYPSCARSWKRRPDVGSDKDFPDLSKRDAEVVRALRGK